VVQLRTETSAKASSRLLLVLGLLKFTAEDEALFLLDEPDTHLNPLGSVEYLGFLDRFVKRRENCHIVMATHDPLLFASLLKEQVRIIVGMLTAACQSRSRKRIRRGWVSRPS
jgi:predicted ATPase